MEKDYIQARTHTRDVVAAFLEQSFLNESKLSDEMMTLCAEEVPNLLNIVLRTGTYTETSNPEIVTIASPWVRYADAYESFNEPPQLLGHIRLEADLKPDDTVVRMGSVAIRLVAQPLDPKQEAQTMVIMTNNDLLFAKSGGGFFRADRGGLNFMHALQAWDLRDILLPANENEKRERTLDIESDRARK